MKQNVDDIIEKLKSFVPQNDDDSADLYELMNGLEETENSSLAIPAMFELMEKYPNADLGSPGALVHSIESIGGFKQQLIESVERVPTYLNIWMVNRLLNSFISESERRQFNELLKSVSKNSKATEIAKESAKDFLEYQENLKD